MPYVFARAAAYYSPLAGGVVDFPIGLKLQQAEGSWVSECGTKAIHDAEVMDLFLADGSLQDCSEAAEDPGAAEDEPAQDSDAPSAESQPAADRPAPRKPAQKPRAKA